MRHLIVLAITLFIAACSNAPEQKVAVSTEQAPVTAAPEVPVEAVPEPSEDAAAQPQTTGASKPTKKQVATAPKKSGPMPAKKPVTVDDKRQMEKAMSIEMPEESLVPVPAIQRPPAPPPLNHKAFEQLLQKYVDDTGKVNYKALKTDKAALDAYCQLLTDNPPQEGWSRNEALAYWINAYNAYTLKLIVDNYPTSSIIKLDGGKTWDVRRIKIGGNKYSLNNIENDIIRPKFQEPRIHFAVNCAAKSCPPLWNHAYTADNLETALESRARAFINNSSFNTLAGNRARVSKIFDWYGADFGDLRAYLNKYADNPLDANASIRFNEYDWDLND